MQENAKSVQGMSTQVKFLIDPVISIQGDVNRWRETEKNAEDEEIEDALRSVFLATYWIMFYCKSTIKGWKSVNPSDETSFIWSDVQYYQGFSPARY